MESAADTLFALMLVFLGGGILLTAYRGWQNGVLQAGAYFFRKQGYRPTRAQEPVAFYFFAIIYIAGGIALLLYGLGVLTGQLHPLPLN